MSWKPEPGSLQLGTRSPPISSFPEILRIHTPSPSSFEGTRSWSKGRRTLSPLRSLGILRRNTVLLTLAVVKINPVWCKGLLRVVVADMFDTFHELWQDLNLHLPSLLYIQNFLVPHPIWSFPTSALARPRSSSDRGMMGRRPSPGGSCRGRYGHPEAESCSSRRVRRGLEAAGGSVMPLRGR